MVQTNYQSLGQPYILPRNRSLEIQVGQGYHSQPGYAGKMTNVVQLLSRMLYGTVQSPSNDLFQFKLFGISPIGSILLQEIARYDSDFGDYNLFHSVRLAIHYASDELLRLYVPPPPARQAFDPDGKRNRIKCQNEF